MHSFYFWYLSRGILTTCFNARVWQSLFYSSVRTRFFFYYYSVLFHSNCFGRLFCSVKHSIIIVWSLSFIQACVHVCMHRHTVRYSYPLESSFIRHFLIIQTNEQSSVRFVYKCIYHRGHKCSGMPTFLYDFFLLRMSFFFFPQL